MPLLGIKTEPNMFDIEEIREYMCDSKNCLSNALNSKRSPKCVKQFEVEVVSKCKNSTRLDAISVQEEIEQGLIERCVHVDVSRGITTAKLPFVTDPDSLLNPH